MTFAFNCASNMNLSFSPSLPPSFQLWYETETVLWDERSCRCTMSVAECWIWIAREMLMFITWERWTCFRTGPKDWALERREIILVLGDTATNTWIPSGSLGNVTVESVYPVSSAFYVEMEGTGGSSREPTYTLKKSGDPGTGEASEISHPY